MSTRTGVLRIEGMSCAHCVRAVREALEGAPGVEVEAVELGRAVVRYDDEAASVEELAARVEEAGYSVTATEPS
jgi:copper chaperone CopZ